MSKSKLEKNNNFSDEQLVSLIKSGEYEHFGALLGRYAGYITSMAQKYGTASEKEDLISEGFLELFKSVLSYSEDKGTKFKTFSLMCIKNAMFRHYNKNNALKRIPDAMISPIEDADVSVSDSPESLLIEKEGIKSFFDIAKSELSDFEYTVFCSYIFGKSYKEIAEDTGKSVKAVDGALTRVRGKLKK